MRWKGVDKYGNMIGKVFHVSLTITRMSLWLIIFSSPNHLVMNDFW